MLQALNNRISGIGSLKKFALLLCAVLILTISIGTSFSYVITGTPTLINIFLNGLNPDGDLVIQKTVNHPFGDTYSIPEELSFAFEVDLGAEYANKTVKTTQGEKTADENGCFTVTVTPGGRTTVYDIDEGTPVTVTETQIGKGFTPDAVSQDITIQKYQDNLLTFANTYTPEKANASALTVSGVKTLVGREWIEGDSFTFDLSVYQDGAWSSLGAQTVTYELVEQPDPEDPEKTVLVPKPDYDKFDFSELIRACVFDVAGTYSFRITEVEGTIGGLTYDKAESKFDVLVGDADMDGYLEIQSVTTTTTTNTAVENKTVSIAFENKYAPEGSAEALIEIVKVLEDTSGRERTPAGYTFELYDGNGNLLMTSEATDSLGEATIRLVYEPTDAGRTFTYLLKETNSGETVGALTYDAAEYRIRVSVVDNLDGSVSAHIDAVLDDADGSGALISGDATNAYRAVFTNIYDPEDAVVSIGGEKTLSGRPLRDGEFTFHLYAADKYFTVADGAKPLDTARNDGEGSVQFDALSFAQVGTYYYTVTEDASAKLGGITYDDTRYLVTVKVTDVDGVLKAETVVTDSFGAKSDISFANEYHALPITLSLGGRKVLNGAKPEDGMFSFLLFAADATFAAEGEPLQAAGNDSEGNISFAELKFTEAGTYRYVVMEDDSAAVEDMVYDDTVYRITVEVSDPGEGQLKIGEIEIQADGQTVGEIVFENTLMSATEEESTGGEAPTEDEESTAGEETTAGEGTTEEGTEEDPGDVDTGDHSEMLSLLVLTVLSGMVAIALAAMILRRKQG